MVADDFDESFPGWRDRLTPAEKLARFGEVDWVPRPSSGFDDDPYSEVRPRDE